MKWWIPLLLVLLITQGTHFLRAQKDEFMGQALPDMLFERFDTDIQGNVRGAVERIDDVVGWGGLTLDNQRAARFDGAQETCIDHGCEKKIAQPDFTVEAYIKPAPFSDYAAIAADWNEQGDQRGWALVVTPRGGLRFDVSPDGKFHAGNKLETAPRLIRAGQWYHVAAVSEGSTSRIFVNGHVVAEGTRAVPGIFAGGTAHLKIGNVDHYATAGPRPWRGVLDEVRITLRSLAPGEFLQTRQAMPEPRGPVPAQYELPFTATSQALAMAWQQQARNRLFELVERQQPRNSLAQVPLDFQLGTPEDRDGYRFYSASFQGNDGQQRFECSFAVPHGQGPFPAMVAVHGHGGSRAVVFDRTSIYHGFADRFARGGYVVIAPSFPHRDFCATMLWDLIRLVDILQSRPEVDPQRIGVAGLSMGGEWTMWTAACDTRVKAAVVSGWMCTTEGVFSVPNCPCWELPGFVELMDVCEVHLLIAPRPVLFESAEHDNCFPIKYTREGFSRIQAGYRLFDAEEHVRQDVWPAGHEWHGNLAYPFIDRVLGGHAANVAE